MAQVPVRRSRWAAIGAALAVSVGAGGVLTTSASVGSGDRAVFVPITPCRLFDTRGGTDNVGPRNTPVGTRETFVATVRGSNGKCTIPADATAVGMNVAIVGPTANSFLLVYPADQQLPLAANMTFTAGQAPATNAVTATLSADGKIGVYNYAGSVDVVVDVLGYYVDHHHDDRYYTKDQVYSTGQLVTANNGIGVLGRMTKQQVATGQWQQDPGRPASIAVGNAPWDVAYDGSNIWVTNSGSNNVSCIDPANNTVVATVPVGTAPLDIAWDGTWLWVANSGSNNVSRIDPTTNHVDTYPAGLSPYGIASDGTNVWVANAVTSGTVTRLRAADGATLATIPVGNTPHAVVVGAGYVWAAVNVGHQITRIDPATNTPVSLGTLTFAPEVLTFDGKYVWIGFVSGNVGRIEQVSGASWLLWIRTETDSAGATGMAYDGSHLWLSRGAVNIVQRRSMFFDVAGTTMTSELRIGSTPGGTLNPHGIAFDGTDVWVAGTGTGTVERLPV